ncbi:MAG: TIGR04551 family protein, partial [Polyangiaceae bacterium]
MHRFSSVLGPLAVLVLSLPATAFAQAGQGSGGNAPASSATPPASEPSGAPGSATPPPSSVPSASPPPAPASSGQKPPPDSAPAATGGATIDRSSLLPSPPARGTQPASAEPAAVEKKDNERKVDTSIGANPKTVYAEDWWVHSRPVFEMHGILRTRAELFHNFSLGRWDNPDIALWPQPIDNSYSSSSGTYPVRLCGDTGTANCEDKSQAGANMRFRINPELHISDNLRVMSQIDMLDNLVLGSTPSGYNGAYSGSVPPPTSPYAPIGAFSNTQVAPTSGLNNFQNSINIRRAWGEYATPVGQLRFGRMPNHWGLGILENSGDTYDSDWQSTVDRIMFTTGIKSLDLYVSGSWDFPNEGPTSATREATVGGQPYDLAQLDDTNQYTGMIARRRNPELQKMDLARGDLVLNGGVYFQYRDQLLAYENPPLGASSKDLQVPGSLGGRSYVRRNMRLYTPDVWFQLLYKKFRFELEGSMI